MPVARVDLEREPVGLSLAPRGRRTSRYGCPGLVVQVFVIGGVTRYYGYSVITDVVSRGLEGEQWWNRWTG